MKQRNCNKGKATQVYCKAQSRKELKLSRYAMQALRGYQGHIPGRKVRPGMRLTTDTIYWIYQCSKQWVLGQYYTQTSEVPHHNHSRVW
jgi:hypothetical protein